MPNIMYIELLREGKREREREREEERERERWVKHYSSYHRILLVGEGDFSFSLSLARSFGSATNILATSLDSYDDVIRKYKNAKSNLEILDRLGASVLHRVDATKMKLYTELRTQKFDRIIFNFPHAGFYGPEDAVQIIEMHRNLVQGFLKNASGMLTANGEIHITHKTEAPFSCWNLEELAAENHLTLTERVDFSISDYPSYKNKRGSGPRCDEPFPLGRCSTFKFKFLPILSGCRPDFTAFPNDISFSDHDLQAVETPHHDALVVSMRIANLEVFRTMISFGCAADILFVDAFNRMGLTRDQLTPVHTPLVDMYGMTYPIGAIELPVTAGTYPRHTTVLTRFIVMDVRSPYNVIIGRPTLSNMRAVCSIYHLVLKFPTSRGVGVVKGDQTAARNCLRNFPGPTPCQTKQWGAWLLCFMHEA